MLRRLAPLAALFALSAISATAHAADYKAEYDKKIKASQDVGVLGDGLAGDQVNFYTGATSFSATDLSIPGNSGLPVAVGRTYDVEHAHQRAVTKGNATTKEIVASTNRPFGDWDVDVPYIGTTMTHDGGWVIDTTSAGPNRRCSVIGQTMNTITETGIPATGAPPWAAKQLPAVGQFSFTPGEYWHGYDMHVSGGSQSLLLASLPNSQRPTDGKTYHWTTNQNWWLSCLDAASNPDAAGEGFLAVSPDGTKYTFNKLSKRKVDSVTYQQDLQGTTRTYYLFRAEYRMLPSRIEDRFGNWVEYEWSVDEFRKLRYIRSSDGRAIELVYDTTAGKTHLVTLVKEGTTTGADFTAGTRSWQYAYATYSGESGATAYSLSQVTLPDGSAWKYNLSALNFVSASPPYCQDPLPFPTPDWACFGGGVKTSSPKFGDVTHPSGAKVEFTFDQHFQIGDIGPNSASGYSWPFSIVSKRIIGPGLTPATWQYAFSPSREQAASACQAGTCPSKVITDQIDPDGSISRRIFGLVSLQDQTLLLGQLEGKLEPSLPSGGSQPITCSPRWGCDLLDDPTPGGTTVPVFYRELDMQYVPHSQATPYVARVGVNPLTNSPMSIAATTYASERRMPVQKKITTQQGVNFTWQVDTHASCSNLPCFDVYGNPTRVTRFSTGNAGGDSTRTEVSTYTQDTTKWVIGLPVSLTDVLTNKIVSRTQYDTNLLPWKTYAFEALQQTTTYNANGTVATVMDALNNTTTLGANWKRGVPQSIAYPNSFQQAATVNDSGWITSVTDNRGSGGTTVTGYGYDPAGRMNLIDYPNDDTVLWNDTSRSFTAVTTPEFGLPGAPENHWKQIVQTGNGRTTTFYDARWRPVLTLTEDLGNAATKSYVVKRFDNQSREIFASYAVGSLTSINDALTGVRTFYDALGRAYRAEQDSELGVLATTTEFLPGFVTRATNPRGKQSSTSYKVFDSPSTDSPVGISLPTGVTTTIARQPSLGKTVSVTRSGSYAGSTLLAVRSYGYDANERLCTTINPESGATIIAYDAAGNIAWSAEGSTSSGLSEAACNADRAAIAAGSNNRTIRTYDSMNRVLTVTTPDHVNDATYTYTADGLLNTLSSGGGVWAYSYLPKRRLLSSETLDFYGPYTINHAYDANASLLSITSPNGTAVNYAPNALGQATQAGPYASGVQYYPNGALKQFTYGNGVVHTMDQNARKLPMRSRDAFGGTEILDDNYSYDANGNVATIIDDDGNARNTTRGMAYDDLDRLTTATGIWGNAFYTYDPLDNLRTSSLGVSGFTYIYDANNRLQRLDRSGGGSYNYTYDVRGNVSNDGRNAYTFTQANRLANILGKDSYQYDGHGRRIVVWRADGTAQVPVYGQDGVLRYIADNKQGGATSPIYLAGSQIAESFWNWTTGVTTVKYVHTDALGSPVAKSDGGGAPIPGEAIEYAPYGAPINRVVDGQGYTGHVMDQSSGLIYMQQRYYDPQVGRFLSVDPLASEKENGSNFNRYFYATNNPFKFTDPDGRQSQTFNCPQCTAAEGQHSEANSAMASGDNERLSNAMSGTIPIAPLTPSEMADRADNVATAAGAVEVTAILAGQPEVAGPAGVVSVAATVVATLIEPTPERGLSLVLAIVTAGASRGLEAIDEVIPSKAVRVGVGAAELTKAATKEDKR